MSKILSILLLLSYASMGASFSKFFPSIIANEGTKFTAYRWDKDGGGTKYGITLSTLKWMHKTHKLTFNADKDHNGKVTAKDLHKLTIGEAESIYKSQYWDTWSADYLLSQTVAESVADNTIMGGYGKNFKHIRAVNKIAGKIQNLTKIDTETVTLLNKVNERDFIQRFSQYRWKHLQSCKSYRFAKRGWLIRVNSQILNFNQNETSNPIPVIVSKFSSIHRMHKPKPRRFTKRTW